MELLTLEDHPFGPRLTPAIEKHTLSTYSLNLASTWLQLCLNTHQRCTTLTSLHVQRAPTRLVDVGLEDNRQWRLIETEKGVEAGTSFPYMTLSYRWGLHPKILLTLSSLESFQSENPIAQLPLTFRDAIFVVRHLGYRYLWIDSLCIIQDSVADWEAEAPMMRYIYANSICNLAATASRDPDDGMFRERDPAHIGPYVVESTLSNGSLEKHFILSVGYWVSRFDYGVLHSRGWVFQECFLAPRVLYFTNDQIMWECTETHGCEAFPDGVDFDSRHKFDTEKVFKKNEFQDRSLESGDAVGVWMSLVGRYSRCELTRAEDRLFAFAGIAKLFQEMTGYRYLAGLWEEDLLHQLGWSVLNPSPRLSNRYRAPSWSWASVDGSIEGNHTSKMQGFIQIIDVDVTSRGVDSTVDAADGYLILRCPVATASYMRTNLNHYLLEFGDANARCLEADLWHPDTNDEKCCTESGTIEFFFYCRETDITPSSPNVIQCIIIERARGADNVFKRVGAFRIFSEIPTAMEIIESDVVENKIITLV